MLESLNRGEISNIAAGGGVMRSTVKRLKQTLNLTPGGQGESSWTEWTIGDAFAQQVPGNANGVTELRCLVTCPHCHESINVAAANAKKNLSLTARQHLKKCTSSAEHDVVLPSSKRPRSVDTNPGAVTALLEQEITALQTSKWRTMGSTRRFARRRC